MKIIKYILMLIALPLALCGCNQEDDVFEIFSSGLQLEQSRI